MLLTNCVIRIIVCKIAPTTINKITSKIIQSDLTIAYEVATTPIKEYIVAIKPIVLVVYRYGSLFFFAFILELIEVTKRIIANGRIIARYHHKGVDAFDLL